MQRRGAAGLLLLGLLLGTCLAGSRAQWVCMGGHLPGGGRDRGVQGSPNKTPLTSPDALFYLHHLRSCAMCPVGAVATGGIGTTGGGGVDLSSFYVGLSHLVCLLCCRVWELPGMGLLLLASSRFSTLPRPFPGRSLGSRLLGYQCHFLRTRCRLLSGVLTWLLLRGWPSYMGNLLYLFWVLHNPSSHNWRPCRSTRGLPWSVPFRQVWRKSCGRSLVRTCRWTNCCGLTLGVIITPVRSLVLSPCWRQPSGVGYLWESSCSCRPTPFRRVARASTESWFQVTGWAAATSVVDHQYPSAGANPPEVS